jgi:hypothetical protein
MAPAESVVEMQQPLLEVLNGPMRCGRGQVTVSGLVVAAVGAGVDPQSAAVVGAPRAGLSTSLMPSTTATSDPPRSSGSTNAMSWIARELVWSSTVSPFGALGAWSGGPGAACAGAAASAMVATATATRQHPATHRMAHDCSPARQCRRTNLAQARSVKIATP